MAKKQPTQFIYYINGKGYPLTAGKDGVTEEVITVLRDSYHREYLNNRYERENSDHLFELHKDLYEKNHQEQWLITQSTSWRITHPV